MRSFLAHWREYAAEAAGLALFMLSASVFGTLLQYPGSALRQAIDDTLLRRALMGCAMGATSLALVYSPLGARSGAHLNPALTLTFFRLRKIAGVDLVGYLVAQFVGGLLGIVTASAIIGAPLGAPTVHYVATVPGVFGPWAALGAEFVIAFLLMTVVLVVSNHPRWSRLTGVAAAILVALYITFEDPLSGMSLNPARSFGSAWPAHETASLWVYFLAPPLGMLLAAETYVRRHGLARVFCAKLHHPVDRPCIFRCRFHDLHARSAHVSEHAL